MSKKNWKIASGSLVGKRDGNDDAELSSDFKVNKQRYLYISVADGVGSRAGSGEVAELTASTVLFSIQAFLKGQSSRKEFSDDCKINYLEFLIKYLKRMTSNAEKCTTIALAIIGPRAVTVIWAGDSRVYTVDRGGNLNQCTTDHSDESGAICSYVKGDGEIVGTVAMRSFSADDIVCVAAATDGVTGSCEDDELRDFLVYATYKSLGSDFELIDDLEGFLASNISDNATVSIAVNEKNARKLLKRLSRG